MTPQDWQPIDTAPKDASILIYSQYPVEFDGGTPTKVLPYVSIGHWWRGDKLNAARWSDSSGFCGLYNPTHWMPLPAPPSDRQER